MQKFGGKHFRQMIANALLVGETARMLVCMEHRERGWRGSRGQILQDLVGSAKDYSFILMKPLED